MFRRIFPQGNKSLPFWKSNLENSAMKTSKYSRKDVAITTLVILAISSAVTYALYKRTLMYEKKQKEMSGEEPPSKEEPSRWRVAKIIRS